MAIEHNAIGVGEIHEPKGITTASSGDVYIANGAGSGGWEQSAQQELGSVAFTGNAVAETITTQDVYVTLNPATWVATITNTIPFTTDKLPRV